MTEKLLRIIRLLDSDNSGKKDVIESILEETNGQETNIIEFKATAFRPQNVDNEKGGTKEDDYKWNVLKAIIAFANTSGGVVFVGIKEDKELHELQPYQLFLKNKNEYKNIQNRDDEDEYIRAINERILQKTKFTTTSEDHSNKKKDQNAPDSKDAKKDDVYQLSAVVSKRIQTLTTISRHTFRNYTVFAIRVNPGDYTEKLLVQKENSPSVFFVRGTAQIDAMTDYEEIESYKRPVSLSVYDSMPPLHSVPAPCERFVGRDKELEDLHRLLSPDRKEQRKIPVLIGPMGIGKSQLAYKYCEQYRKEYPFGSDIKISGENLNCARDILLALAEEDAFLSRFHITFTDDERKNDSKAEERRADKVKYALFNEKHNHILIFLKNVDNPSRLFLDDNLFRGPGEDFVHVLAISSPGQEWDSDINENDLFIPYEVKPLTEEEGMELLFQLRPFDKGGTEEKAALEIVRILEGHPGRLADAGNRLKMTDPRHDDDYSVLLKKLEANPSYVQEANEFDEIRDRIHRAVTGGIVGQDQSFCSIGRPISKSFVGRLEELRKLNGLVFKRDGNSGNMLMRIPVITGDAGVGKTELAVAYACAYADKFPQGRFLIPMQRVTNWADAMTKLVESCDICGQNPIDTLGLPEDFSKLPPDEKRIAVYRMLLRRAQKGALLLLLDNLEDMRLISENDGLKELPGAVPANLHMIATTRINEDSSSSLEVQTPFEIGNLEEKDALELFCRICDRVFPFADYPFEDGKLQVDLIPEDKRPKPEKTESIERDYGVLMDIIRLLNGHAWSVEIVAGRIAFKSKRMKINIQKELAGLHDNLLGNLTGKTYRSAGNKAENLLQQTFDLILKQDELVEGLGQKIMRLAEIASFFPPDQIPEYALKQIWIGQFGDEEISFEQDGMPLTGNAYEYAVTQLSVFRITGGEEPMFKMHRLTREVLLNRLAEEEKLEIVRLMRKCLDDNLKKNSHRTSQFLQPWCAWINEWITALPALQEDTTFQKTLLDLAESCLSDETMFQIESCDRREMITETKEMLAHEFLNRIDDQEIKARFLLIKGSRWRHFNEPEKLLRESLAIWRKLASVEPEKYNMRVARTISLLAYLHCTLDQNKEANEEYNEAYTLYQKLEESNPEKYSSDFAAFLNNHAILNLTKHSFVEAEKRFSEALKIFRKQASNSFGYTCIGTSMANLAVVYKSCRRYEEAEAQLKEALSFFRNLMEEDPEEYTSYYAAMLVSLASLYDDMQRFQEAESEYKEALAIFRGLEEKNPEKYSWNLAELLRRLADYHSDRLNSVEAEKEYKESLEIFRKIMQEKPEVYSYDFACTLNNSANLHSKLGKFEDAENEYSEALPIFRKLAANNPQMHQKTLATFLNGYASFLFEYRSNYIDALSRLKEALTILRGLAGVNPSLFDSNVASCLCDIGFVCCRLKEYPTALSMLSEALQIYRNLSASNSQYKNHIANTLCHLAEIHVNCGQTSSAYSEYKEALDIFRELAILFPSELDSTIAMVLGELGDIHLSSKRLNEAESDLSEALVIYRNLDKKNPGIYSLDIALCLERLVNYYELTGCHEKVKSTTIELMNIFEKEKQRDKKNMSKKELQHMINILQRLEIRMNKKS